MSIGGEPPWGAHPGPRRVLVTGGTGLVGRELRSSLAEAGWSVVLGVRSAARVFPEGQVFLVLGELEDYTATMDLNGFDAVVHLAAKVHEMDEPTAHDEDSYEAANVRATLRLAKSAADSGVEHFVFLSSIKVNGEAFPPEAPANERLRPAPQGPYARSKARAEKALLALESPMSVTIIRSPLVYGPGVGANFGALLKAAQSPVPLPLGAITAPRSMIAVRNLASAILTALEHESARGRVFVVRDGRDLPVRGIVRQIRRASGRPNPQVPVPRRVLELGARLLGLQAQVARLTTPLVVDDSAIRSTVGWRPVITVEQGLGEVLGKPRRPKRLLFVVSEDWYFWSHRVGLARRALDAGWEVHLACRLSDFGERIAAEGILVHSIRLARAGLNPLEDLRTVAQLRRVIRDVKPDLVHSVAIKPVIYGSIASGLDGVPASINTLAGMGSLFSRGGASGRAPSWTRRVVEAGLRGALRRGNSWLVVQNSDDYELVRRIIVDPERLVLIPGSGLDLNDYPYAPREREDSGEVVVTHVSRMLWEKGVEQAVEAVSMLRADGVRVRLQIVGSPDPENPSSIPREVLEGWARRDGIDWLGQRDDVPEIWRKSDIAVLASYYGEGIPRVLLEAAATGLPLLGCDAPGTRDLIEDGVNGLLVPPRDPRGLAGAIARLVHDPGLAARLGREARARVVDRYCDDVVLAEMLSLYDRALGLGSGAPTCA